MKITKPDYNNSILNVSHTIIEHYKGDVRYDVIPELKQALDLNFKHVCLVLLDGMGQNIVDYHLKPDDFIKKHVKKTITSVFPPTTVAATNAVLTCNPPFQSGYLGWVQYFKKEDSNHIVFLNKDFYDPSRKFNNVLRDQYLKQPLIYDYIKAGSPDVKTYELFPAFRKNGYPSFRKELQALRKIIKKNERNFSYVYWTNPDMLEHETGIMDAKVKEELKRLNGDLESFAESMDDDTLLVVIADHGLVDVKQIEFYQEKELVDMLVRMPSIEPRATNFFVKKDKLEDFKTLFNQKYRSAFKLYSKDEFLDSGLLGHGEKHPLLDDFLGDFIAVATSHYFLTSIKSDRVFKAHHAGLLKGEMEVPLIIYHKKRG